MEFLYADFFIDSYIKNLVAKKIQKIKIIIMDKKINKYIYHPRLLLPAHYPSLSFPLFYTLLHFFPFVLLFFFTIFFPLFLVHKKTYKAVYDILPDRKNDMLFLFFMQLGLSWAPIVNVTFSNMWFLCTGLKRHGVLQLERFVLL